jgi:hypothetical protein
LHHALAHIWPDGKFAAPYSSAGARSAQILSCTGSRSPLAAAALMREASLFLIAGVRLETGSMVTTSSRVVCTSSISAGTKSAPSAIPMIAHSREHRRQVTPGKITPSHSRRMAFSRKFGLENPCPRSWFFRKMKGFFYEPGIGTSRVDRRPPAVAAKQG